VAGRGARPLLGGCACAGCDVWAAGAGRPTARAVTAPARSPSPVKARSGSREPTASRLLLLYSIRPPRAVCTVQCTHHHTAGARPAGRPPPSPRPASELSPAYCYWLVGRRRRGGGGGGVVRSRLGTRYWWMEW
jgi:hypothetical protein